MSNHDQLIAAADAIGSDMREQVVFVGGCTVHLYLDDQQSRVDVRPTEDVDVILEVFSTADWHMVEEKIRSLGFSPSLIEDDPICRYRKGAIIVDFMPTDEDILGFSNPWYPAAIASYNTIELAQNLNIRYVSVGYFILTKFAAYNGRGNGDILASHDIEDILMVFGGRSNLERELTEMPDSEKQALQQNIENLMNHDDYNYAVNGCFRNDQQTAQLVFGRINNAMMFLKLS